MNTHNNSSVNGVGQEGGQEKGRAKIIASSVDSSVHSLYEKREKIYTRSIEGHYQRIRTLTGWPLLLGFFLCPWLEVNGHQAILFDLPARQFHVFWLTFWPQDFSLLAWALMISAFALFFVTNLFGRVWCGYSCPQTVWTAIFMWMEQFAEGERHQRIRLDKQAWNAEKIRKRTFKHFLWIGFALLTGATFIGYFYGMNELVTDALTWNLPLVAAFWTLLFTSLTYINAGWMREQVCIYMCPYARFQSAMFDKDTLIVSYDEERGEPRGSRRKDVDPDTIGMGSCIDCNVCVHVCPTGIDIRDGLQYKCINCAACVDACNDIMDKMGYERGLVRYTTENIMAGKGWTWKRPRLIGYGVAMIVMLGLFGLTLLTRVPLQLDVLRGRGELFQQVAGGDIQNTYTLKIINKDLNAQQFSIGVTGLENPRLLPDEVVDVEGGSIAELSLSVIVAPESLVSMNTEIEFVVNSLTSDAEASAESRFLGPAPGVQ